MDLRTLVPHPASTGPQLDFKTDYRGQIIAIRVRRGGEVIEYERTNRRGTRIFNESDGELHGFFSELRDFAKVMTGKRILDLGCGGGALVNDLRSLQLDATGIDLHLDESSLRRKYFIKGDAFALPFPNQSFDCITSIYSVFHYEPPAKFERLVREAMRVLKPGGRILLSPIAHPERFAELRECVGKRGGRVFLAAPIDSIQIINCPV